MKTDDFLIQVQVTEARVAADIQKAKEKAKADREKEEKRQEHALQENIKKERTVARNKIKEASIKGKKIYEDMVAEGNQTAQKLKKDGMERVKKAMPTAEAFFVSDVLV